MEILEGVYRIDEASANMAHSNVYLIVNGKELTVIDTGTPGNAKKIVDYIEKIGHKLDEVTTIILTHFHMDHVGSAKELKELLNNAKIASHVEEADYISGKKPLPKPYNILFRAFSSFIKPTPVEVTIPLKDNDKIGTLRIIYTPGHTPGSIALLDEERKVLFAGDTLRYNGKKVSGAPEQFSLDANMAKQSIGKIAALDFEVMLPGHGEPLMPKASDAVKEFSKSIK
jgi:glyoxylase-like metal-dependent hydrolase (beta-lactamase superfamily II)